MKLANARDPDTRFRLGARGFLEASSFAAMVVTYGSQAMKTHSLEYGPGYSTEVHDYIYKAFVRTDPLYDAALTAAKAYTWDKSSFSTGYAAERWLKPSGFQNGVSRPIIHQSFGEVWSVHMNSYTRVVMDRQLARVDGLVSFLAEEFAERAQRAALGLSEREVGSGLLSSSEGPVSGLLVHFAVPSTKTQSAVKGVRRNPARRRRKFCAKEGSLQPYAKVFCQSLRHSNASKERKTNTVSAV